jgi:hypothetical protein
MRACSSVTLMSDTLEVLEELEEELEDEDP